MQRTVIQIARVRMADLRRGDVINGRPDDDEGWFMVQTMRQLPSGELVAGGNSANQAAKGHPFDLCGVQVTKQVEVPSMPEHQPASAN